MFSHRKFNRFLKWIFLKSIQIDSNSNKKILKNWFHPRRFPPKNLTIVRSVVQGMKSSTCLFKKYLSTKVLNNASRSRGQSAFASSEGCISNKKKPAQGKSMSSFSIENDESFGQMWRQSQKLQVKKEKLSSFFAQHRVRSRRTGSKKARERYNRTKSELSNGFLHIPHASNNLYIMIPLIFWNLESFAPVNPISRVIWHVCDFPYPVILENSKHYG